MKESEFFRQNKEKWEAFENDFASRHTDPDALCDSFIQLTDDLSYANTFYKNRSIKLYLNDLTLQVYQKVFSRRGNPFKRFWHYWREDLPRMLWEARMELLLSFIIFSLAFLVGVVSTLFDANFANVILGPDYIATTKENIAKGDPMGIYKNQDVLAMFLMIVFNNILIAFRTFISGILGNLLTFFILLYNGVMVGVFQTFFYNEGLLLDSALVIWLHGTLEIGCIVLSGAAGLTLGKGIMFPGTYTRLQAMQKGARQGMNIMVAVFVLLLVAGFIESFITRHADMPAVVKASLILVSAALMLGYFVWLPRRKSKKGFAPTPHVREPINLPNTLDLTLQRGNDAIFRDLFVWFRKYAKPYVFFLIPFSIALGIWIYATHPEGFRAGRMWDNDAGAIWLELLFRSQFFRSINLSANPFMADVFPVFFTGCFVAMAYFIRKETEQGQTAKSVAFSVVYALLSGYALTLLLKLPPSVAWVVFLLFLPMLLYFLFDGITSGYRLGTNVVQAFTLPFVHIASVMGLLLMLSLLVLFINTFGNAGYTYLLRWIVEMNIPMDGDTLDAMQGVLSFAEFFFVLGITLPMWYFGFYLQYLTMREILNGTMLRKRIEAIGKKR